MTLQNFLLALWLTTMIFIIYSQRPKEKSKHPGKYGYFISFQFQNHQNPNQVGFGDLEIWLDKKIDSRQSVESAKIAVTEALQKERDILAYIIILNIIKLKK